MATPHPVRDPSSSPRPNLDAESAAWLDALRADGATGEEALGRLFELLLRATRAETRRRSERVGIAGPELDDVAHQAAADALLAIVRKLDDFRGDARFTTWAYKFAVLEVSSKLGRHFWRQPRVALDVEQWERLPGRIGLDPEEASEAREALVALHRAVDEELTPRQRAIFVAIVLQGVPLDALTVKLGATRNAIYKTLFDARRKLWARLVADGHLNHKGGRRS